MGKTREILVASPPKAGVPMYTCSLRRTILRSGDIIKYDETRTEYHLSHDAIAMPMSIMPKRAGYGYDAFVR